MKRNAVLKILNPILAVLVLNQVLTALLGGVLPRDVFEVLHEGGGFVFAALAVLHLALNWNWVRTNFFPRGAAARP